MIEVNLPPVEGVQSLADRWGISPLAISSLIYRTAEYRKTCPLLGRTRVIPHHVIPQLERDLRDAGAFDELD